MSARVVELTFPAQSRYLVLARLSLAGIAAVAHLDVEQVADLKLAVTEVCANAVQHAYPDDSNGDVRLRITVEQGAVAFEVSDDGRGIDQSRLTDWDAKSLVERGMGLSIVRSVVDELEIDSPTTGGTVVRFKKKQPPF